MDVRKEIIEYSKIMVEKNLTKGTAGNISVKYGEGFIITPSGMDYGSLRLEDLVYLSRDGEVLEGNRKPSSEYNLHGVIYKNREVGAVVHTHSPYISAFSALRMDLPPIHYVIGVSGSSHVKCAEYATYGTMELAENALRSLGESKAVILANHGLVTVGKDLKESMNIAEDLEFVAQLYLLTLNKNPVLLSEEEMEEVLKKFKNHGQK